MVLHLPDNLGGQLPHSELSRALVFTQCARVLALIRQSGFLQHQLADLALGDQGEALVLYGDLLAILQERENETSEKQYRRGKLKSVGGKL